MFSPHTTSDHEVVISFVLTGLPEYDTPFQVLIQPSDVVPPNNCTTNWIPSPAGGGSFLMDLRFYCPESALTDGTWVYLSTEVIGALTT